MTGFYIYQRLPYPCAQINLVAIAWKDTHGCPEAEPVKKKTASNNNSKVPEFSPKPRVDHKHPDIPISFVPIL